jgi:hypothetical protein
MADTVKIYTVTTRKAYRMDEQGTRYTLRPWGKNTEYYEGYDDGGKDYTLPEGIHVDQNIADELMLWDAQGRHHELVDGSRGPAIMDASGKIIPLVMA